MKKNREHTTDFYFLVVDNFELTKKNIFAEKIRDNNRFALFYCWKLRIHEKNSHNYFFEKIRENKTVLHFLVVDHIEFTKKNSKKSFCKKNFHLWQKLEPKMVPSFVQRVPNKMHFWECLSKQKLSNPKLRPHLQKVFAILGATFHLGPKIKCLSRMILALATPHLGSA